MCCGAVARCASHATGQLTWAGWVYHSWRFEHADVLRQVDPATPERGSKTSTVPVVWATSEFFRRGPNDFLSGLVTMDETWLYHYDPETKQQSMEWWHIGLHHPKNSECKNPMEKFSPRFFGIKMASSSPRIFQRAKQSTPSITHLCWCNWRTFEGKRRGKVTKGSCSYTTVPRLTGHLQPRRNWPTWASSALITHPTLRICPRRTTTCSLDWNKNWKFPIFLPTRRLLLPRRPGWTDNFLDFFFFWVACKIWINELRSVLSYVGSMLNKSRVWSL